MLQRLLNGVGGKQNSTRGTILTKTRSEDRTSTNYEIPHPSDGSESGLFSLQMDGPGKKVLEKSGNEGSYINGWQEGIFTPMSAS